MSNRDSSGYVKIWKDTMQDSWFLSLNGLARGVWLQLILLAKCNGDTGGIFVTKMSHFAQLLQIDRRTLGRIVTKMQDDGKIILTKEVNETIHIFIPKYEYWQRNKKHNTTEKVGKDEQKCQDLPQNRPTKPNQTNTATPTRGSSVEEEGEKNPTLGVSGSLPEEKTKYKTCWKNDFYLRKGKEILIGPESCICPECSKWRSKNNIEWKDWRKNV
jgi:hypothetical protein